MGLILNIETATAVCSVVIAKDGEVLSSREDHSGKSHSALLTVFIEECAREAGINLPQLDAVAVSMGPGSYTGLRIGVAAAKGLCFALDKPLIAINTLQSMAAFYLQDRAPKKDVFLCPMIDARRMEVYTAIFSMNLDFVRQTSAEIIDEHSISIISNLGNIVFFGDGMIKCQKLLSQCENAEFDSEILANAHGMVTLSEKSYRQELFENLAYFEPYYLKDFLDLRQPLKGSSRQQNK
jgi:tRNA threonylcarbamoyladenosine biosynthesis protein TsaB